MGTRKFASRTTAHRYAERQRPDARDRFVLSCTDCPPPKPSRRRPPRWATVARTVAAAVGVPAEQLREALDEALKTEKDRKR